MSTFGRDMLERFGPVDEWLLSAEEIERVMLDGPCRHLIQQFGDCRECMPAELTRLQIAILARRLGCSDEDATAVGDKLTREYLEHRR
jgi:hypothetical protein